MIKFIDYQDIDHFSIALMQTIKIESVVTESLQVTTEFDLRKIATDFSLWKKPAIQFEDILVSTTLHRELKKKFNRTISYDMDESIRSALFKFTAESSPEFLNDLIKEFVSVIARVKLAESIMDETIEGFRTEIPDHTILLLVALNKMEKTHKEEWYRIVEESTDVIKNKKARSLKYNLGLISESEVQKILYGYEKRAGLKFNVDNIEENSLSAIQYVEILVNDALSE